MRVSIEENPAAELRAMIDQGLDAYNEAVADPPHPGQLWVVARGGGDDVQGGLKGNIYYRWLHIEWLWVAPAARGTGLGSALLAAAEAEARRRDCIGAYVETYSFQAPHFYTRHGFEEFGRIDGFPPGHACLWLKKALAPA